MQSHALEMAHVAAAARAGIGRFNFYAGIHKALRAFMTDTLLKVGRTDPTDEAELARAVAQVTQLMALCAGHVEHENQFAHPMLEARTPGVSATVAEEHVGHIAHIAHLRDAAQAVGAAPLDEREAALHALYLALALFVADNLQHMHKEETVHNAALWAAYSDAELIAMHDALIATIPPEEMMLVMGWMLPNLNARERLEVMQDMRAKAPPPAFKHMLDAARGMLAPKDTLKLARGLELPPVPGLTAA